MPKVGYLPIPKKLLQQGVKDMVLISDARMSGTPFGKLLRRLTAELGTTLPRATGQDESVVWGHMRRRSRGRS
jgi:dihydroxy-acid dehydratase